ncbi:glycosyltransferase [Ascidiaceihabitans sp.]|nr:glycosyltransferase [Ascidiaceihabitans sp.]
MTVVARDDDFEASNRLRELGCKLKLVSISDGFWGVLWLSVYINLQYVRFNFGSNKPKNCIHFLTVAIMLSPIIWCMRNKNNWVSIEGLGSWATSNSRLKFVRYFLIRQNIILTFTNLDEQKRFDCQRSRLLGGIGVATNKYDICKSFNRREIGYFGRLLKDKGIFDVIRLAREIKRRSLPLSVIVYGERYPNNPSSLSENDLIEIGYELDGYLHFRGFTADVNHAFSTIACLVLPSKREGFPVVVMEASACGVPSICYNVPGCQDAVTEGVNGFLIAEGDIETFIRTAIEVASSSEHQQSQFSDSCRRFALQNFDDKIYVDKVLKIISDL